MTDADDTIELLESWHAGDRQALEELLRRHLSWMSNYVHQRLGTALRRKEDTQDLVQEAMLDLLVYGPRFQVPDRRQFRGLLARIVENNIRDRDKWLHRNCRNVEQERSRLSDSVLALDPAVESVTRPSVAASKNESREWIRLALEFLDPPDREVLWLHVWDGLAFAKIGAQLGISEDAARMRFQRALPRLAEKVHKLRAGRVAAVLDAPA